MNITHALHTIAAAWHTHHPATPTASHIHSQHGSTPPTPTGLIDTRRHATCLLWQWVRHTRINTRTRHLPSNESVPALATWLAQHHTTLSASDRADLAADVAWIARHALPGMLCTTTPVATPTGGCHETTQEETPPTPLTPSTEHTPLSPEHAMLAARHLGVKVSARHIRRLVDAGHLVPCSRDPLRVSLTNVRAALLRSRYHHRCRDGS